MKIYSLLKFSTSSSVSGSRLLSVSGKKHETTAAATERAP